MYIMSSYCFNYLYINTATCICSYSTVICVCMLILYFVVGPLNRYYLGFFANYGRTRDNNISVVLITGDAHQVTYSIEAPSVGYYHNGTLSASHEVILNLSSSVQVLSHDDRDKGIYLTASSENLTVIGQSNQYRTSDSYFALPIIELDDPYVYYGISVPRTVVHSNPVHSSILIVGTENNTMMKLTATQSVTISIDNTPINVIPDIQYSFVVNRLQTVYIGSFDDLSGTKIVTDRPVSVFSGHECGNVPTNVTYCDHLIEQIPPTALWGKVYYVAPLANRTSYTIKVLAAYHSTTVNIYCNNTGESYTINEGQFINRISQMNQYCAIYSTKKILVVQFSHGGSEDNSYNYGDPMMTLVPATNQYLNKFHFPTTNDSLESGIDHYVNIIVMAQDYQPNMIHLIAEGVKRSLATQQWVPIQVNSITEAYATQVRIPEGINHIVHTDPAAQMTVIVYGFKERYGYGHIGGIRHTGEFTNTGC